MSAVTTIAVVGATGATAGGLARAILSDPAGDHACRAITRTPGSARARALSEHGAEVVQANLDDYDSLVRAFDGADAVFCMTNFFVTFSAEQETQQAANQARAAAAAGVRHAIWSTAEDTRRWYPLDDPRMPTLPGGYKVPNWDGKGEGDQFFATSGVPTTYLLTPFHWEAFVDGLGAPQPGPDGVRTIAIPLGEARLPGIAAEDIGRCAYAIFRDPSQYVNQTVGIAGDHTTGEQLAAGLSEVFGEHVHYQHVPADVLRALPFPGADLAANMFQFVADDNGYGARRDVALARTLNPSLASFNDWVMATRRPAPAVV